MQPNELEQKMSAIAFLHQILLKEYPGILVPKLSKKVLTELLQPLQQETSHQELAITRKKAILTEYLQRFCEHKHLI